VYEALRARGQDVTLREFVKEDGADAHCQVNNLRLAHQVVFDWLDRVFSARNHHFSGVAHLFLVHAMRGRRRVIGITGYKLARAARQIDY
jgi:hypothetical protein